MPMPSNPLAHLIVGHAKVAFGVLKVALDKVALSLVLGQLLLSRSKWRVAEGMFDFSAFIPAYK